MMTMSKRTLAIVVMTLMAMLSTTTAFAPVPTRNTNVVRVPSASTSTELFARTWNFNEGRSPWGLKKNAEIWNGRVAQMGFTITLLQELITGKGVIQGIQDGDALNIAFLGVTVVSVVGLSAWLAIQGDDEFVDEL
mmetsp:Transcript_1326/g.1833  ORF Transcript_1326/g.1833 Transcript_1326/m.1833 type:complete len:136 (-) Transcript_1326:225-632(-)